MHCGCVVKAVCKLAIAASGTEAGHAGIQPEIACLQIQWLHLGSILNAGIVEQQVDAVVSLCNLRGSCLQNRCERW